MPDDQSISMQDLLAGLAAQRDRLDLAWICNEWQTLADSDDPRMTRFLELVARVGKIGDL